MTRLVRGTAMRTGSGVRLRFRFYALAGRQLVVFASLITALCLSVDRPAHAQYNMSDAVEEVAASLGTQAVQKGAKILAVVGFSEINGYQSALTDYLTEEFTTALFKVGDFSVVERSQLSRVLKEHELYATNLFDGDHVAELQKLLGVDAIVTGTVTRIGQQLRINVRVVDVSTARVFGAAAATIDNDPLIEGLLGQSSIANRSKSSIPGQVNQPSDVVFQSAGFTVTPISVIRAEDGRSVKITAQVFNTGNEAIRVGHLSNTRRTAITHAGTVLRVNSPSGMNVVVNRNSPTTEVLPGSTLVVQWVARTTENEHLLGDSITLRDEWRIQTRSGIDDVQVQFPRIMIE